MSNKIEVTLSQKQYLTFISIISSLKKKINNEKYDYVVKRNSKFFESAQEEFQEKLSDIQIDLAATKTVGEGEEKSKVLLKDAKGNYEYSPENSKKLNRKTKEMFNEQAVNASIYCCKWELVAGVVDSEVIEEIEEIVPSFFIKEEQA